VEKPDLTVYRPQSPYTTRQLALILALTLTLHNPDPDPTLLNATANDQ